MGNRTETPKKKIAKEVSIGFQVNERFDKGDGSTPLSGSRNYSYSGAGPEPFERLLKDVERERVRSTE